MHRREYTQWMDEGTGHHMTTLNEKSCFSLTDLLDGFSVTIVHRLLVHFYFWYLLLHSVCRRNRGGAERGQLYVVYSELCTYCSTVLDLVCIHNICFCSSQTWCLFLLLPFTCEKLRCLFSVLCMNTGFKRRAEESGGEKVECKHFTIRLVFYRMRYLKCYTLGPTWKMFDVHILSINVGIHYISVLIKYFFSRGKTLWLCMWKRRRKYQWITVMQSVL